MLVVCRRGALSLCAWRMHFKRRRSCASSLTSWTVATCTTTFPSTGCSTRTRWSFTPPRSSLASSTCTGGFFYSNWSALRIRRTVFSIVMTHDLWTDKTTAYGVLKIQDDQLNQQAAYSVPGPETCQYIARWARFVLSSSSSSSSSWW